MRTLNLRDPALVTAACLALSAPDALQDMHPGQVAHVLQTMAAFNMTGSASQSLLDRLATRLHECLKFERFANDERDGKRASRAELLRCLRSYAKVQPVTCL